MNARTAPARAPLMPLAPTIDDPMALLTACHDKVRQFTQLAEKLAAHVATHGVDHQAREAATAVLRYFELAAPRHHADEDDDLFPALRALNDPALDADMQALSDEHDSLGALWAEVARWLRALTQAPDQPAASADVPATPHDVLTRFAHGYRAHAQREEEVVYPHALRLPKEALARLAQAMVQRRTSPVG